MSNPLCHKHPITHLNHKCPIPISPLCSEFRLHVYAESFHIMSIDVPAGVDASPFNTQCLRTRLGIRERLEPLLSWSLTLPLSCDIVASWDYRLTISGNMGQKWSFNNQALQSKVSLIHITQTINTYMSINRCESHLQTCSYKDSRLHWSCIEQISK